MLDYIKSFKCGDTSERLFIEAIERGEHGHVLSVLDNRESETLYYTVNYDCEESIMEELEQLYADQLDCPETDRKQQFWGYWDEDKKLSKFQLDEV